MDYKDAFDRLANHANMPTNDEIPETESVTFSLWRSTREAKPFDLDTFVWDVLKCLEVANKHVNGPVPSSSAYQTGRIDEDLVYVVCSIIDDAQEYSLLWTRRNLFDEEHRGKLAEGTWKISHAWCALLSGDIDSLGEYVELQGSVKEILDD